MQRIALDVSIRERVGKNAARRLRADGQVPAIVYGHDVEPVKVQVASRALERVIETGANALIDLGGPKELSGKLFLIKEAQRDPLTRALWHCDFYSVDTRRTITVSVRLGFEGKAVGVEMGGVLEPLLREVEVTCLPLSIPDEITVDVSALAIGDSLRVSDLVFPEGVTPEVEESVNVVHVIAPRVEEEAVAEEELAAAEGEAAPAEEGAPAPEGEAGEGEGS